MTNRKIVAIAIVAILLALAASHLTYDEGDRDLTWSYMESYNPDAAETLAKYTDDLTVRTATHFALLNAGVSETLLGDYPINWDNMVGACGIDCKGDPDSKASVKDLKTMIGEAGPLKSAIADGTPLIANGLAAPIFEFTDGKTEGYTNADSTIMRFCVYVESEHDTDLDGEMDLVKVFLQVPRSAMEGKYKAPVIFEARVYSAGTGEAVYDFESSDFDIDRMYDSPEPRKQSGTADPMEHALASEQSEWYYEDVRGEMMAFERLDALDDLLVRGYAFATASGIGTYGSDGIQTCQTDVEMEAYRSIVEWFAGDAVAYTDRTSNIAIKADWCSGDVGMLGRSYAGCSCIALAAMGIDNLKAVYEYSGMESMYNYVNSQGCAMYPGESYLAFYTSETGSAIMDEEEWERVKDTHLAYWGKVKELEKANNGDYNSEWARRAVAEVIPSDTAVMICHGLKDYNVVADCAYITYMRFVDAGMDVKVILHQGGHDYLSSGTGSYDLMIGREMSSAVVNRWFSHYLFSADNKVEEMPDILMQSADCISWTSVDGWGDGEMKEYRFPSDTVTLAKSDLDYGAVSRAEQIVDLDYGTYLMDIEDTGTVDGRGVFHLRIKTDDLGREMLPVSVYLFDVSEKEFEFVDYVLDEAGKVTVKEAASWVGGGLGNYDILNFETMKGKAKLVTYGYADLYNPTSTKDPETCAERTELDSDWYDYDIYLNCTKYEVAEGHHMVAAITPLLIPTGYVDRMLQFIDEYSFTVDLRNSWVSIPFS